MAIGMSCLLGATTNIIIIGLTGWVNTIFGISLFFIFIILSVIGACFLGEENEVTVVTSVNASYLCMRGVSMLFGGYPAETRVFSVMFNKYADPIEIGPWFYIYLGAFVGGCFFFVFLQKHCKILRPNKHDLVDHECDDDFTDPSKIGQNMEQTTAGGEAIADAEAGVTGHTKPEVLD